MNRALDILVGLVSVAIVVFAKLPNPADPNIVPLSGALGSFLAVVYYGGARSYYDSDLMQKGFYGGVIGTGVGFFVYIYALIIGLY
jgi:hypothetical protein